MIEHLVVMVPRLAFTGPELKEAHATLKETPRNDALAGEGADIARLHAIHLPHRFGLLHDVEGVARLHLHAVRQFVTLNPRIELRILLTLGEMTLLEFQKEIKLTALLFQIE